MTLLDTSSLVHLLRRKGDPAAKERVNSILLRGDAAICDMVVVELWMGVASKEDEKDVVDLSVLLVSLPIDEAVWQRARELAAACRKARNPGAGARLGHCGLRVRSQRWPGLRGREFPFS